MLTLNFGTDRNTQKITYQSEQITVDRQTRGSTLNISNGLTCICDRIIRDNNIEISWKFNWEQLIGAGIDGLSGQIIVKSPQNYFPPTTVNVDLTDADRLVTKTISTENWSNSQNITFELSLLPYFCETRISFKDMFSPSEKNDTILLVGQKKMHVNRAFLSYHSDFFRGLFSPNFKEGQMNEIPIEEVSYEDLGLLLSSFHPKPVFPNDKTVDKLLEMADRFDTSSVIGIVEYHLIHNSRIGNEKMMWLADNYGMTELLEKKIHEMSSVEKAKALKESPEYKKLSDGTKAKVLDRLMELI
uniref:BTB domain-containing protein n=1 Tax=Caenorhabditis tropicalis TaxID=1561998 RepID=A0A1I7TGQ7_9PELO